jgi:opacity protein-like surface antigen
MISRSKLFAGAVVSGLLSFAVVAPTAAAQPMAGPEQGRFTGSVVGGIDIPVGGDVHGGATSAVIPLGTLNPAVTGVSAELRIESRGYADVYDDAVTYGVEGAFGLSDNAELFGSLRMLQADEGTVQVGNAVVTASTVTAVPVGTRLPVQGRFGAYEALLFEAGYRQFFDLGGGLRPYVAGRIGFANIDEIRATFTVPGAGITLANVPFYDETTAVTLGGDVGVLWAPAENIALGVETGLRWTDGPEGNDAGIGPLGLGSINDEGSRLSVPIMARASLRF